MNIAVDLRFILPIRMLVGRERSSVVKYVVEMTLPSVSAFICRYAIEYSVIGDLLQIGIQSCVNAQPTFVYLIGAVFIFQITPNLLHKIGRQRVYVVCQFQLDRLVPR